MLAQHTPEQLRVARQGLERLTVRESEVLLALVRGETAGASAERLGISRRTVELHRQSILHKANVRNTVELVGMIAQIELEDAEPKP